EHLRSPDGPDALHDDHHAPGGRKRRLRWNRRRVPPLQRPDRARGVQPARAGDARECRPHLPSGGAVTVRCLRRFLAGARLLAIALLAVVAPVRAMADIASDHPAAILVFPKLVVDTANGLDTL